MRNHTNKILVAIIAIQGMLLLGQWSGQPNAAHAKIENLPDPGARQLQMIDELKAVNNRLERALNLLQSGEVQVKVKQDAAKK